MTIIRFDLKAQIAWRAMRDRKTQAWVGICDALKLTVEADTWSDLQQTIDEVQQALFSDLLTEGELERFLRDHGWSPVGPLPQRSEHERVRFDMPWALMRDASELHAVA